MHIEWYYWVLGAILSILFLAGALFLYLHGELPTAPEIPTLPLPVEPILLKYASATTIHPSSRSIADQPKEWRESLRRSGAILKAAGVKAHPLYSMFAAYCLETLEHSFSESFSTTFGIYENPIDI